MPSRYDRPGGRVRASAMHGTLCPCAKEAKGVWQLLGKKCFARLSPELKTKVAALTAKSSAEEYSAVRQEVLQFLKENQ